MFDFSFSEVALIGVVALVVIGPERLPRVARTAGVMVNRAQRYAASVRADIEREVELSEMRRVQTDLEGAAQSFQADVRKSLASAEAEFEQSRQAVMQGPIPVALADHVTAPEPASAASPPAPAPAPAALMSPVFEPAYDPAPGDISVAVRPAADSPMGWQRMLGPSAAVRGPRSGAPRV